MNKYQDSLDNFVKALSNFTNFKSIHDWKSDLQELVDRATPKKPQKWTVGKLLLNRGFEFNCPVCNSVHHDMLNFCPDCGQALDWGK